MEFLEQMNSYQLLNKDSCSVAWRHTYMRAENNVQMDGDSSFVKLEVQ